MFVSYSLCQIFCHLVEYIITSMSIRSTRF
nr:MAG TPA: hypothetical protein [Caudoviricetes sp.]DAP33913.1 MAG TPA: hypothetical protein [Caudoviricetes sp.]